MEYRSTRDSKIRKQAAEVIAAGISNDGGLFIPANFPDLKGKLSEMSKLTYNRLAEFIFSLYLTDFTAEEIAACVGGAYTKEKFGGDVPVRLVKLNGEAEMLELWHGPTSAFKDMALQILPYFLLTSMKKVNSDKKALILTATSGDTGKAALEGFKDVENVEIIVFYPKDGVSDLQKRQMDTQEGENVHVCAINGNFDDAQTAVKAVFTDAEMKAFISEKGYFFSSANSINFGRLLPQVVYYFYAYFDLHKKGRISSLGEKINIVVPTGNFGNILAAYYAYRMGLPVNKFICASNANNVLADFINTGVYDKNRGFFATVSPSMDILISSNLERLLSALYDDDDNEIKTLMESLKTNGKYEISSSAKGKLTEMFYGGFIDDEETKTVIERTFDECGYLCDTHTAVAVGVYETYKKESGDNTPAIIISTASPYKFAGSVLSALGGEISGDEFAQIAALEALTHTVAQPQIRGLEYKKSRFDDLIDKEDIFSYVKSII